LRFSLSGNVQMKFMKSHEEIERTGTKTNNIEKDRLLK
jgi:hypothetical protein